MSAARPDIVEIYRRRRQWRWRYKAAGNHKILADGSEGYHNLSDLQASLKRVLNLDDRVPLPSEGSLRIRRDSDWAEVLVVVTR